MSLLARLLGRGMPLPQPSPLGFALHLPGPRSDLRPIRGKAAALASYVGWVHAAAGTLAQDVAAASWRLWRPAGGDRSRWQPVDDPPVILRRPNGLMVWAELIELTQLHLDLTGEAFWHLLGEGPLVEGVEPIYPHWVEAPVMAPDGRTLAGWRVQVPGHPPRQLPAADVVFLRYPHPVEPLRGASPVEAFALSQELDLQARAYAGGLIRNRATPELVITSDEELTPEQADLIRERWLDRYRDPAAGPAVLGRNGRVQQLGLGLRDLAFLEVAQLSREQIFAIYKVPAAKVGLVADANRANAEAADRTYKQNALLPRLRRLEAAVNERLLPRLGPGAGRLWFEFDDPLEEAREAVQRRAVALWEAGAISLNRLRELVGEPPLPDGEVYRGRV